MLRKLRSVSIGSFALSVGMFLAITTSAWFPAGTFRQQKVFETHAPLAPQIVQIMEISSKTRKLSFGEAFSESGEWLKGTKFKVRNNSGREIVYLELRFDFPETTSSGNEMSFPVKMGLWPNLENQKGEPISIKSNEEVTVGLTEDIYSRLKKFIEHRQSILGINKAIVYLSLVIFSDGIGWNGAEYLRQDPSDPRRYLNIGAMPPDR